LRPESTRELHSKKWLPALPFSTEETLEFAMLPLV
jgi:hypothetical protein